MIEKLKPVETLKGVEYGLITPDGLMFACSYCGHGMLTYELREAGLLPKQDRGCYEYGGSIHVSGFEFDYLGDNSKVTQKQLDTMFDYAMTNGIKFNFEKLEIQ